MTPDAFADAITTVAPFGWLDDAIKVLATHMAQDGGHDFAHLTRVMRNAHRIASEAPCDWEVIAMSVIFHDAINLPKNHPERHLASTYSAQVGEQFARLHLDDSRVEIVEDAIRAHSHSAGFEPRFFESCVLADADRLESLGAFGIARTFYVSGVMGRSIVDMADPFASQRPLDDLNFAVDHFFRKLLTLHEGMHTSAGKALAEERHRFLQTFLDQLSDELGASNSSTSAR